MMDKEMSSSVLGKAVETAT